MAKKKTKKLIRRIFFWVAVALMLFSLIGGALTLFGVI